ncbi:hypothetical protein HSB1_42880 [Halogranum salarium B-1]|uniref:histidine kinase n=2 Tax=Halogranum rubrum TaxID=553466 RepID=J2Z9L3_9EURY|nr:hypothetical protein HSB1_42880 [Halogranum salarium B-1]
MTALSGSRIHPATPLFLLTLSVVVGSIAHFVTSDMSATTTWIEAGIPSLLSLSFVYAGYRVTKADFSLDMSLRVVIISLGLACIAITTTTLVFVVFALQGPILVDTGWVIFLTGTAGAASGAPLGFYYYQQQRQNELLETQYEEIAMLHKRLSVASRVLRHNLRNELTIILGTTEILREDPTASNADELFDRLEKHHRKLRSISEKSGHIRKVWETELLVDQPIDGVVSDSVNHIRAVEPAVSIQTDIRTEAMVDAHPHLELAIKEALTNAITHNSLNSLVIEICVFERDGHVRIEIADTGSGISEDELAFLDSPSETALTHGTGLGLWLMDAIMLRSGGELSFQENDPSGTIVIMDLPLTDTESDRPLSVELWNMNLFEQFKSRVGI